MITKSLESYKDNVDKKIKIKDDEYNQWTEKIDEIKKRVAEGDKKSHIARDFGISRETLYQYLRKQGWVINDATA